MLLSGGIDSAVAAILACEESETIQFLSFDYGQRNRLELERASAVARALRPGAPHDVISVDVAALMRSERSALLSAPPSGRAAAYRYYVPGRNLIFLAHAAALAEVNDLDTLYVGSNLQDAPRPDGRGYPDSGPAFIEAAEAAINAGLKFARPMAIRAPLLHRNKFEAIQIGWTRGFDFALTWSCYTEGPLACGECAACRSRLLNFHWAGLADPVAYRVSQQDALENALIG